MINFINSLFESKSTREDRIREEFHRGPIEKDPHWKLVDCNGCKEGKIYITVTNDRGYHFCDKCEYGDLYDNTLYETEE